ncbi:DUF7503 family protein [Halorussus halophilus]|nr:hypothetical protein [Halorussus halophilus]
MTKTLRSRVAKRPRLVGALFALFVLLASVGNAAAGRCLAVIFGP